MILKVNCPRCKSDNTFVNYVNSNNKMFFFMECQCKNRSELCDTDSDALMEWINKKDIKRKASY